MGSILTLAECEMNTGNLFCLCSFSYEGRWKQKLQTTVDFPLDSLDLSQYVIGPKQILKRYSLYGVSVSNTIVAMSF